MSPINNSPIILYTVRKELINQSKEKLFKYLTGRVHNCYIVAVFRKVFSAIGTLQPTHLHAMWLLAES